MPRTLFGGGLWYMSRISGGAGHPPAFESGGNDFVRSIAGAGAGGAPKGQRQRLGAPAPLPPPDHPLPRRPRTSEVDRSFRTPHAIAPQSSP